MGTCRRETLAYIFAVQDCPSIPHPYFTDKSGEHWSTKEIAEWLGISVAAAYALVSGSDFPLPVRGFSHSRQWSQTLRVQIT
jgi:hypothetical protein